MTLELDSRGMLATKRHKATLEEIHSVFVTQAPFPGERREIWSAFLLYHRQILNLMPETRFWLNGGFITQKTWAPPKDIDVALIAPTEQISKVHEDLLPLLTDPNADPRWQPMGGAVDAFLCGVGTAKMAYWSHTWTRVTDCNHELVDGETKGYVEVVPE